MAELLYVFRTEAAAVVLHVQERARDGFSAVAERLQFPAYAYEIAEHGLGAVAQSVLVEVVEELDYLVFYAV